MPKAKVEFSLETIKQNPTTKKQLEGFIAEVVICKRKIKDEREAIRDITVEAKDSLGIPGKVLNRLVKENMDPGSLEAEASELETVQSISEALNLP